MGTEEAIPSSNRLAVGAAAAEGISRVVIGLDGSAEAANALTVALRLLPQDASFWAIYALNPSVAAASFSAPFAMTPPEPLEGLREALEEEMAAWCKPLQDASRKWSAKVVDGATAPALMAAAVEAHADLIVVGHRHHGALAEMVLGGTGHDLLRHSHCPVLLIPAPALPPARSS